MANVFFKRGSQANLDTLITQVANEVEGKQFVEGSFYLTNDTNRLYFAQSSTNLVNLNQYIHIWEGAALPTSQTFGRPIKDGDFFYWIGTQADPHNILCIYKNNQWIQINPDTNLGSGQTSVIGVDSTTNGATVGVRVTDTANNAATGNFSVVGGENVTITQSGNTITIASKDDNDNTEYTLNTAQQSDRGRIVLTDLETSTNNTHIDIVGDGTVDVTSDANGTITVTGAPGVTSVSNGYDADGVYTITLGGIPNGTTADLVPTIRYGGNENDQHELVNTTSAVFNSGTATLNVYTKGQIDQMFVDQVQNIEALQYAGTVDSSDAANKIKVNPVYGVGTVYKAAEDFSLSSPIVADIHIGDLIIAEGNNDNAVTWSVVPSGNDQQISMSCNSSEKAVTFVDGLAGHANLGIISMTGGRKTGADADATAANAAIEITATTSNNDKNINFNVVHGAPGTGTAVDAAGTTSQTTGTALTIPVITGITKDAQGHITAVTKQNYTLTDTHAELQAITKSIEASNNAVSASFSFQLDTQPRQSTGFTMRSDTLSITTQAVGSGANADTQIVVNLEWGTF